MSFITEADRIGQALTIVRGVKCVTRGWPTAMDSDTLPCIVVQKAGEKSADRRDDREYLTEVEYYIRVFSKSASEADRVAADALGVVEGLGYERVFGWEEFTQDVCRVDMRVRSYF